MTKTAAHEPMYQPLILQTNHGNNHTEYSLYDSNCQLWGSVIIQLNDVILPRWLY